MEHSLSPSAAINKANKRKPYVATSPSKNSDLAKFEEDPEKEPLVQGPENHSNAILFFGEEGEGGDMGAPLQMDVSKPESSGWHVIVALGNIAMYVMLPIKICVEMTLHLQIAAAHAVFTTPEAANSLNMMRAAQRGQHGHPNMRGTPMLQANFPDDQLGAAQAMNLGDLAREKQGAFLEKMRKQHAAAFGAGQVVPGGNLLDKSATSFVESSSAQDPQAVFDQVASLASDSSYGWSIMFLMVVSIVLCQIIACCGCCGPMRPMGGSGSNSGLVWTAVAVNLVIVILECVRPSVLEVGFRTMTALWILPSLICMTGLMGGYFSSLKK
ncbi:unnamed protein product [Amoebophrya sp. A25]|nr:unnamed protein product [Amoebophrya sp. A25]|eukprot:GSA25T00018487001.1